MKSPETTAVQLQKILKEHIRCALKHNTNRGCRNGNRLPLSSWMKGAPAHSPSKIKAVSDGEARYPYRQIGHGALNLAAAIARRYDVTWVQRELIEIHVFARYRGNCPARLHPPAEMANDSTSDAYFHKSRLGRNVIDQICSNLKTTRSQLPLRALIDQRVTNMLLLLELKEAIELKTPSTCKI